MKEPESIMGLRNVIFSPHKKDRVVIHQTSIIFVGAMESDF
jgi:hypothetical protein